MGLLGSWELGAGSWGKILPIVDCRLEMKWSDQRVTPSPGSVFENHRVREKFPAKS